MLAREKGSSPGRVEESSRAMLATARPSCFSSVTSTVHVHYRYCPSDITGQFGNVRITNLTTPHLITYLISSELNEP